MENQQKKPSSKLNTLLKITIILGIILVSLSASYYFISKTKNSYHAQNINMEEDIAKQDFADAIILRIVGNCDLFANSVSESDPKIREFWGEKCRREKQHEAEPIKDFLVKRISIDNGKAFVQAELIRSDGSGKDKPYTVSYELTKEAGKWKLIMP